MSEKWYYVSHKMKIRHRKGIQNKTLCGMEIMGEAHGRDAKECHNCEDLFNRMTEPQPLTFRKEEDSVQLPVSLRDYLAGQALAGIMSANLNTTKVETIAIDCYALADAMFKERNSDGKNNN